MTSEVEKTMGYLVRRCEELELERDLARKCAAGLTEDLARERSARLTALVGREVEADHQALKAEQRTPATAPELADQRPAPACGYLRVVALDARVKELEGERDEALAERDSLRREYQTQLGTGERLATELQHCQTVRDGHAAQLRNLRTEADLLRARLLEMQPRAEGEEVVLRLGFRAYELHDETISEARSLVVVEADGQRAVYEVNGEGYARFAPLVRYAAGLAALRDRLEMQATALRQRAEAAEGDALNLTRANTKLQETLQRLLSAVKALPAYDAARDGSPLAVACGEAHDVIALGPR